MKEFHRGTLSDERSCLISCDKIVFSRVVDSERGDFDNYICRYPCNRPTRQLFLEALFKQEVGLSWQFAVRLNDRNQIIESWENRND